MREKEDSWIFEYSKRNRRNKRWKRIVSALACCVVFCTVYALILPAITQETATYCGLEEHIHDESCYTQLASSQGTQMICSAETLGIHTHGENCYDANGNTICNQVDYVVHNHNSSCYDATENLICTLPEIGWHVHSDSCYQMLTEGHTHCDACYILERLELICQMEETEGHAHGEGCYVYGEQPICQMEETGGHAHGDSCYSSVDQLICQREEIEGHAHGAGCYSTVDQLVCQSEEEGHIHDDSCYEFVDQLICQMEETEGHTHGAGCYESVDRLTCQLEEVPAHAHSADCYEIILVCEVAETEGHAHTDECYVCNQVLICDQEEIAAEYVLVCTISQEKEHIHSDACFQVIEEKTLTCTQEEGESHTHTAMCYGRWDFTCELEEHTHELMCYSDPTADLETRENWEATLSGVALTGDWRVDVIAIAESQLGYHESTRNYIVAEDGKSTLGYTRYGDWYGVDYGHWCAMFVSFCLDYADVEGIPLNSNCQNWIDTLSGEDWNLYREAGTCEPQPGDLIFFDWELDGHSDHIGLVKEVTAATEAEAAQIKTIEGNSSDRVQYVTYEADDARIMGYGMLPEQADANGTVTLTATIYTDGTYSEAAQDDTVITVTGEIPEDAEVRAYSVTVDASGQVLCAYDIAIFLADGSMFQPAEDSPVEVAIMSPELVFPDSADSIHPEVYYVPDEGEPERIETEVTDEGVVFDTDHFSTYMVLAVAENLITTQQGLAEAITQGVEHITLGGDFGVYIDENNTDEYGYIDGPLTIPAGKNIVLDLYGHTIWQHGSDALFVVPDGTSLTIIDSVAETETVETVSEQLYGNAASVTIASDDKTATLIYYVTESGVMNTSTGSTQETLMKHTVTTTGSIVGGTQPVFRVNGGTVNIESGMIRGGSGRAIIQTAGTTNLSGGYICGFTSSDAGGAINASGGTLIISESGVLAGNSGSRGGAIYADHTDIKMTGGAISGNTATQTGSSTEGGTHYGGGGIYVLGGTTTISGGYITNNQAVATGYFDGGGGVLAGGNMDLVLSGGYITGNEASSGGGIRTNWQSPVTFTMTGGYVCSNYARSAEGGGVSLNIQSVGTVIGGYINNNKTNTEDHWGGGGLFCSSGSTLYIRNVLVTENQAGGFGGGVAGCSTGRVYICVREGGAIYANAATGENMSGSTSTKNEDWVYAYDNEVFLNNGYQDYFCALNSVVEGAMLGGYAAGWVGSADGAAVRASRDDTLIAAYVMGLTANPTDQAIAAAQQLTTVYINGNTSNTHGGGILCNGYMIIGETTEIDLGARIELSATKEFLGSDASAKTMEEGQFTFHVVDAQTGAVLATASNDANGNINFKERLAFTEAGTFVYYIREVQGDEPAIAYDTTVYRLTVQVVAETSTFDEVTIDGETVTIMKTQYLLDDILIEKQVDGENWVTESHDADPSNSDSSAIFLELTSDATFTNVERDEIKIRVEKKWDDAGYTDRPGSVTVALNQNGAQYGEKVVLNPDNNWSYTWSDLPVVSEDGQTEYSYTVVEDPLHNYLAEYEIINSSAQAGYWIPADSIMEGQQYLIVSPDRQHALYVTDAKVNDGFTEEEVVGVTSTEVTIRGRTYQAYTADSINARSIFRAETTTTQSNERTLLKNMGVNSWLLAQSANGNYLKGCNSEAYSSGVRYVDGTIQIQFEWNSGNAWRTLVYQDGKFTTVADSAASSNKALLYTYAYSEVNTDTTVRITNRLVENLTYELNITKISGINKQVLLAGAEFNLLPKDGETPLYFVNTSPGVYWLSDEGTEGATQTLVTNNNGKLVLQGLAATTYVLRETKAPADHMVVEDMPVTLGENGSVSLSLTIEDPEQSYALPETGGTGTTSYTMAGLVLMLLSAACVMYSKKRGKGAC